MTMLVKRSFLFVAMLMFAGGEFESGLAQTSQWAVFGPVGGSISTLAVDPQNPSTIYAAAGVGMFKSVDGGANWRRVFGHETVCNGVSPLLTRRGVRFRFSKDPTT